MVLAIFDNFTIQEIRKYLTETKTSHQNYDSFHSILINLLHIFHLINMVLTIFDNFTIQEIRKYLTETKTSHQNYDSFQKLILSIKEKLRVEKQINFCK